MTNSKKFDDLTPEEFKELKIEFAPGCFDHFEGTQEELDGLISEIKRLFESGEAQALAMPLDLDSLDEEDLEMLDKIAELEERVMDRKLQ